MARAFKEILGLTGDPSPRRRRHRFVPSLAESTSCLEGRALLSGTGGAAHHAAANLAQTPAGKRVTAQFESILHTAPTDQQLTRWVHKLRSGASIKVLHNDLVAQVRAQQGLQASAAANASIISGQSSTSATRSAAGTAGSTGLPPSVRNGINSPGGMISVSRSAVQLPRGARLSLSPSGSSHSQSLTINPPVTTTTTTTTTTTPATTSTTSTTASTTTTPAVSMIGTPTPLTFAPLTFAPLTFTPTTTIQSPINVSPVSANGTLPFTGTPFNPSPVAANGTLPFTGTPFNPSPVGANGTLPFTGTPFNPSPVAAIGTVI